MEPTETTNPTDQDAAEIADRKKIAKENLPFLDDETAELVAADQVHTGKINPTSRDIDDARSREAQADDSQA